jgi:hypothetical protein
LFLSNPQPLFDFLNEYSIVITPHKFSPEILQLEKFGKYNVSFQIFKYDEIGIACLKKWRQQCIDWCGDTFDEINNRFADQKYLDNWTQVYTNKVKELYNNTSGLAPWNINNYKLSYTDSIFYSNNEPIIFYHFHHFKLFNKYFASNGLVDYKAQEQQILDTLYLFYWNRIANQNKILNLGNDKSTRIDLMKNILVKIVNEKSWYLKINTKIFFIKNNIPNLIKRLIIKLYA